MTTLFEPNEDARTVTWDQAALGPRVGFFEAFATSMNAQKLAASQFGLEYAFQAEDWQQTKALLDAGIENPPQLILSVEGRGPGEDGIFERSLGQTLRADSGYYEDFIPERSGAYFDVARAQVGETVDEATRKGMEAYDARIREIRASRPDLHLYTSDQMFAKVKLAAQEAEREDVNQRRTWGGTFGSFLGGALASMNPATDPLNFFTLGFGGAGKTALTRIAAETGAQGVVETINQVTGVQAEREMLGLPHGVGDAVSRIAQTALGAGALQGLGEAVVAGGRRLFRSTPDDPAPDPSLFEPSKQPLALPHPDQFKAEAGAARIEANPAAHVDYLADAAPLSGIRVGKARTVADLKEITDALDRWDGPAPAFVRPLASADTRGFEAPSLRSNADFEPALRSDSVYKAARAVDPKAFERLEKLTERANTFRRWIDELAKGRDEDVSNVVRSIDARIAALEARFRSVQGIKNKTDIKAQIKEARADRERAAKLSEAKETPDVAAVRKELMKTDEQMRELAPLLGRAYAKAKGEWAPDTATLDAVWNAYSKGKTVADVPTGPKVADYDTAVSLAQRVPILQRATPATTGANAADTASKVLAAEAETVAKGLDDFRASIKALFAEGSDGKYRVGDHEFDMDADKMFVELDDGTVKQVSVREMLDENRETELELEAITSCSMPRRS